MVPEGKRARHDTSAPTKPISTNDTAHAGQLRTTITLPWEAANFPAVKGIIHRPSTDRGSFRYRSTR